MPSESGAADVQLTVEKAHTQQPDVFDAQGTRHRSVLKPQNHVPADPSGRRSITWKDLHGAALCHVLEYERSEQSDDSEEDDDEIVEEKKAACCVVS